MKPYRRWSMMTDPVSGFAGLGTLPGAGRVSKLRGGGCRGGGGLRLWRAWHWWVVAQVAVCWGGCNSSQISAKSRWKR